MRTPTEFELQHMLADVYDPVKAHQYYEKHKHLKGRNRGQGRTTSGRSAPNRHGSHPGNTRHQIQKGARARQRKELSDRIESLSKKLQKLEELIRKKAHEANSEDRKGQAKKERAAKEKDKPKSAAEKAKAARENKKFRDRHKQALKTRSRKNDSHKSSDRSGKKQARAKSQLADLKVLATKVKGQIAVAKQKLAAL